MAPSIREYEKVRIVRLLKKKHKKYVFCKALIVDMSQSYQTLNILSLVVFPG